MIHITWMLVRGVDSKGTGRASAIARIGGGTACPSDTITQARSLDASLSSTCAAPSGPSASRWRISVGDSTWIQFGWITFRWPISPCADALMRSLSSQLAGDACPPAQASWSFPRVSSNSCVALTRGIR